MTMLKALKRTGSNAIVYGVGQGLSSAAAFLLLPLYTRYLPQSDLGKLGLLSTINVIAGILFGMGLESAIFRSYYDYTDIRDRQMVVSTTLILMVFCALSVSIALLFAVPSLSMVLFDEKKSVALLYMILVKAIAVVFSSVPLAIYRARGQAKKYAVVNFLAVTAKCSVIIYLVTVRKLGLTGVVAGDTITAVITTTIMLLTISGYIIPAFSPGEARKLLGFGLPVVPANLASLIFLRADLFFLNRYTDLATVGQYNAALMIVNVMQMLIKRPFSLVWTPMMLSVEKEKFAGSFYARVSLYLYTLLGFLTLGIALFSNEIIGIIAGPGYEKAIIALPILCLAQVLYITQTSLGVGITLKRKTRYIPVILSRVAVTALAANFLLVPHWGILGSSVASLLSSVVFMISTYTVSQKIYRVNYSFKRAVKVLVVFLSTYGTVMSATAILPLWLFWTLRFAAMPFSLGVLFVWRFFEKDELKAAGRQLTALREKTGFFVRGKQSESAS